LIFFHPKFNGFIPKEKFNLITLQPILKSLKYFLDFFASLKKIPLFFILLKHKLNKSKKSLK
jgi:hypothetical protein